MQVAADKLRGLQGYGGLVAAYLTTETSCAGLPFLHDLASFLPLAAAIP